MAGEQLLVGGDDVAARLERAAHVLARRLDAADQLDDQLGALEDLVEVARAARQHAADLGPAAGEALDLVGALLEQLVEGRADGAVAEQADPEAAQRTSRPSEVLEALAPHDHARLAVAAKITGGRGTPL